MLGVFILTLPLPIVVNSFSAIYKNRFRFFRPIITRISNVNSGYGEMKLLRKKPEKLRALAENHRNNSAYDEHIKRKLSSVQHTKG